MKNYNVVLSEQAELDFQEYIDHITYEYKAPLTALRHYEDFFATLNILKRSPESFSIQTSPTLIQQFGFGVRRINFNKMAVFYTIHNNIVLIRQIVAGAIIIDI